MMRRIVRPVCTLGLVILLPTFALAQNSQLTGRVTDASGAVVPGASVKLKSVEMGVEVERVTNDEGYYSFPALLPGTYEVTVTMSGFKPLRHAGLQLVVQQVARLDFKLEVGTMEQSVEVSAREVLLDAQTATLGQVVGDKQITELPLLGRNPYALALLVPGVRPTAGMNALPVTMFTNQFASINGAPGNQNEFLLDGAPNSNPGWNGPVLFPNPDVVQEFKIETSGFTAEYGRASGGVFNVVTKAGTNDLHVVLYEFHRNDSLNANSWFANRGGAGRAPLKLNQFGGSIGAPLILPRLYDGRNRTFFFANVELVRQATGVTVSTTVPTPRQLAGDFSETRTAAGQLIQIYDPFATQPNPSGTGFVRMPFPGNIIPASRIDPVARNVAKYYPAPNTAGNPITGINNFVRSDSGRTSKDTVSFRMDHYLSSRQRLFGRYSYDNTPTLPAPAFGRELTLQSPTSGPQTFIRHNVVIEDSYALQTSLLAAFRLSFSRMANFRTPYSNGFDIATLGFPAGLARQMGEPYAFPVFIVTGFSNLGHTGAIRFGMDSYAWQSSITKNLQRHDLKGGFEYRVIRSNMYQPLDAGQQFSFTNAWTQGPDPTRASPTAGYGLASFLLGVGGGSVNIAAALAQQNTYYALFIQDSYKVTPRLTLNLGLRYDYESPRTDRFDQLSNFDSRIRPPLPGPDLRGALTFVGVNGASRFQAEPDRNNFAPRLGLAYRITSTTVVRAGGGIFFGSTTGIGTGSGGFGVSGFNADTSVVTSLDGVMPLNRLNNPYPDGINQPTGNRLGPATLLGQSVSFFDRTNRVPYSGQWNLTIQHLLPRAVVVEVGYVGSRGLKYPVGWTLNQLPDSALALGADLRAQVPNPFFGQIASGPLSQPTVSRAQLLRPFPHFSGVTSSNANWGSSRYDSLQVKAEKRYSRGLSLLGAYTFSKMMDFDSGTFAGDALSEGGIQNWNNARADWSVSSLDQTHRLVLNSVYKLPFLRNGAGLASRLIGGWEVGVIFSAISGGPLAITSAVNTVFAQGGGQRPNWTSVSTRLENPLPDRWFDTSQFTNAEPYRFGNAPRTFSNSRSDGTLGADLMLAKNTRLREGLQLQFRTEFFNLTNTPRFAPPNISFGSPLFGVVTMQANSPRIVQFALKLTFGGSSARP